MTDFDKVKVLLDSLGIGYVIEENAIRCGKELFERGEQHSKVSGYTGFFTVWHFDDAGKFIELGAFE